MTLTLYDIEQHKQAIDALVSANQTITAQAEQIDALTQTVILLTA